MHLKFFSALAVGIVIQTESSMMSVNAVGLKTNEGIINNSEVDSKTETDINSDVNLKTEIESENELDNEEGTATPAAANSTPAPVTPAPVTPVAPAPVTPAPVAPAKPAPVTPVAPAPVTPAPVAAPIGTTQAPAPAPAPAPAKSSDGISLENVSKYAGLAAIGGLFMKYVLPKITDAGDSKEVIRVATDKLEAKNAGFKAMMAEKMQGFEQKLEASAKKHEMASQNEMMKTMMAKMRPTKVVQTPTFTPKPAATAALEEGPDDPIPETTAQISYRNYDVAF